MNNKKIIASVTASAATLLGLATMFGCASTYSNLSDGHAELIPAADSTIEETPGKADMAVRRERLVDVSATCAYDTLADVTSWKSWDPSVSDTRMVEGERIAEGSVFFQDLGGFEFNARVLAAKRGEILRWRGQDPSGSGAVGVHTWTFVPQPDGKTLVINDEHFHGWYVKPVGWVSDLGISDQFDTSMAKLETAAKERCGS